MCEKERIHYCAEAPVNDVVYFGSDHVVRCIPSLLILWAACKVRGTTLHSDDERTRILCLRRSRAWKDCARETRYGCRYAPLSFILYTHVRFLVYAHVNRGQNRAREMTANTCTARWKEPEIDSMICIDCSGDPSQRLCLPLHCL